MDDMIKTTEVQQQVRPPQCRLIRTSLFGDKGSGRWWNLLSRSGIDLEAPWIQRHIAICPRCQRRFANTGKVHLALALIKSRSMDLGLLHRANTRTVGVLQRGIREVPKAQALQVMTPEPSVFDRIRHVRGSLTQMAACVAIMILGKIGMTASIQNIQTRGQQTLHHYYENQVGPDLADEIFPPQA